MCSSNRLYNFVLQSYRYQEVLNCLHDAINEMQQVSMNLKSLATDHLVSQPDSGEELLVNQLMWRVHELAQSLDKASICYQLVHDNSSPPLSEYCYNDDSDSDHEPDLMRHWPLEDVSWEEILDRQRK